MVRLAKILKSTYHLRSMETNSPILLETPWVKVCLQYCHQIFSKYGREELVGTLNKEMISSPNIVNSYAIDVYLCNLMYIHITLM